MSASQCNLYGCKRAASHDGWHDNGYYRWWPGEEDSAIPVEHRPVALTVVIALFVVALFVVAPIVFAMGFACGWWP